MGAPFPLPKIVYPSSLVSSGPYTTLSFKRQFRKVPAASYQAIRHDNEASSGVREVLWEHTHQYFEGDIEYLAIANVADWEAFITSAITGVPFDLYLDSTVDTFTTYFLEDTTWRADYQAAGQYKFSVKFYQRVAWP